MRLFFQKLKQYIIPLAILAMVAMTAWPGGSVNAQVPTVVTDPGYTAERAVGKIQAGIKSSLSFVFFQAVMNSVNYFLQKAAYDTAVWVASGGKAKVPLFDQRTAGKYLQDTSLDAAGEFIGTFSKAGLWQNLGLDLCTPTLPEIKLKISLGAINTLEPKPKCSFNQIKKNYSNLAATLSNGELLNRVGVQFTGGSESDLGTALAFNLGLQQHISDKARTAELDRIINKGYRAVTTAFSDKITTPADVVEQYAKQNVKNPQAEAEFNATQAFLNKDVLLGSLQLVGNMFIKTLAGQLIKRAQNGFYSINDITGGEKKSLRDIVSTFGSSSKGTQQAAEALYADLLQPRILDVAQYNPLNEYANCPEEFRGKTFKTINSCVLDQSFLQAIEQKLTIRQAVDRGFLHGDWPLIPPSVTEDPFCYTKAYCAGNLAKLRKLRVVPAGFELAAEVTGEVNSLRAITLANVLARFNDCNVAGGRDDAHPFCHLLDENWLLKYPETQCRQQVYGATLAGWDATDREEVCVDTPSCLSEDSSGRCTGGFAYCTREKNVWLIDGDQCPAQFASCRVYTRTTGEQVNYLSNTVDTASCTAANAGCLAYRTTQDTTGAWSANEKLFLNGNAQTCDLGLAGCSKLVRADSVPSTNLLPNGSFEDDANLDGVPDNWTLASAQYVNNNTLAYEGNDSVLLNSAGAATHDAIPVFSNDQYTLLFYVSTVSGQAEVSARVTYLDQDDNTVGTAQQNLTVSTSYQPFTFTFTTAPNAVKMQVRLGLVSGASTRLDGLLLTRGNTYGDVQFAYLKKAPDYLGCTGETNEPQACSAYASMCKKSEVGCQLYQPTDGAPAIPGSVSPEDACPAECVGYAAFDEKMSNFENTDFSQYFIPSTATSCSAANVGCSAFTNLANEKVEYFSSMRMCLKSDPNASIFYTWEGTDTTGLQLKTWNLKKDLQTNGPFVVGAGTCLQTDMATNPDCREFLDQAGNKFYRLYSKTVVISTDCTPYRKTEFLGASPTNTEIQICTDTGGAFDATVNGCVYNGLPSENVSCPANENKCRAFSGTVAGNVRQVFFTNFENGLDGFSGTSNLSNESLIAGGHSLRISVASKNVTTLQFGKSYTVTFWAKSVASLATIGVKFNTQTLNVTATQVWRPYTVGPFTLPPNITTAQLTFGATGVFIDNVALLERQAQIYAVANSWKTPVSCDAPVPQAHLGCSEYKVATQTSSGPQNQNVFLQSFTNLCRPEKVGCTAFVDTKNSPAINAQTFNAVCELGSVPTTDTPCNYPAGNLLCTVNAKQHNCRYNTADSGALQSCASLSGAGTCRDESTYTNVADSYVYLVDDKSKSCTEDQAGCMLLGQEAIDGSGASKGTAVKINTENFGDQLCLSEAVACEEYRADDSTAYFKNPGNKLCEWREGVTFGGSLTKVNGWFKKVTVNSSPGVATVTPPLEPCNPTRLINNVYGISRNADSDYAGLVGLCQPQYDKCTEFIDPVDTSAENPFGTSYYYIKNDRISAGDCGSQGSQKEGCVLFNDTSDVGLSYSAAATYANSQAKQNQKVDAVTCGLGVGGDEGIGGSGTKGGSGGLGSGTTALCDSNMILKVRQDRQCGEWLACETKASIWDSGSGRFRDICLSVAPCTKSIVTTNGTECVQFADRKKGSPLTADVYAARNVNFSGLDYSGYSVPNTYPLGGLSIFNVAKSGLSDWRLVKDLGASPCLGLTDGDSCNLSTIGASQSGVCWKNECLSYTDGSNPENVRSSQQKLFNDTDKAPNNICRGYPEKDSPFSQRIAPNGPVGETRLSGFANAAVCTAGNCECIYQKVQLSSESKYYSYSYFDGTKFFCHGGTRDGLACKPDVDVTDPANGCPKDTVKGTSGLCVRSLPNNICNGGARNGLPCVPTIVNSCPKDAAGNDGSCEQVSKIVEFAGLYGRCVEQDRTTPINGATNQYACLTWYPTDLSLGALDVYNLNKIATYVPASSAEKIRDLGVDQSNFNYNIYLGPLNGGARDASTPPNPPNPNQNIVTIASALCQDKTCKFGSFGKVTVDGFENNKAVVAANTIKTSKLQFYAWTDNDQTPLKEIRIDWDDGSEDVLTGGFYKNHKPYCNQDDFSGEGGAAYCRQNLTTTEFYDTNYTCNTNADCSIFASDAVCKKDKVCQRDPTQYCTPDANGNDLSQCAPTDLGDCKSNTSYKVCKTASGKIPLGTTGQVIDCVGMGTISGSQTQDQADSVWCDDSRRPGNALSGDSPWSCEIYGPEPEFICNKNLDGKEVACSGLGDQTCHGTGTSACIDQRFNGSSIRVCEPNPFTYTHTYQCPKSSGSCSYNIKVTVTDNVGQTRSVGASGLFGGGGFIGP